MSLAAIGQTSATWQASAAHRPPSGPPKQVLSAAADALGLSSDAVGSALKGGSTLADLARRQGVSTEDLTKAVAEGLKAAKPEGAPALSDAQLQTFAASIVSGTPPAGGHHGPPPSSGASSPSSPSSALSALAEGSGTDLRELLAQLRKGDTSSVSSLLGGYGSTGSTASGLLVDTEA